MNGTPWDTVAAFVNSNRLDDAIKFLESRLQTCSSTRFKSIIGTNFTNSPKDIATEINKFIEAQKKVFSINAVYLEMNGYSINTDRWFFDFFGYAVYDPDPTSFDWLSEWDSDHWPDVTLTGLEAVMEDYSWYSSHLTKGYKDTEAVEAEEYASLLIVCKFAHLIEKAVKTGFINSNIPILATAHDFDIISRFRIGLPVPKIL